MKTRDWHKYLHSQVAQEDQLVTALNAYYYLTGVKIAKTPSGRFYTLEKGEAPHLHGITLNIEGPVLNLRLFSEKKNDPKRGHFPRSQHLHR